MSLPSDAAMRKAIPIYSGLAKYFPDALAAVAELSKIGNDQHNPGQDLHWAKEKSTDELDALMRHLIDGVHDPEHRDPDGVLWAVKLAWRALANLQRMADAGDIYSTGPTGVESARRAAKAVAEDWVHRELDRSEPIVGSTLKLGSLSGSYYIEDVGSHYALWQGSPSGEKTPHYWGSVSRALAGSPPELAERLVEDGEFRLTAIVEDGIPVEDAVRMTKP